MSLSQSKNIGYRQQIRIRQQDIILLLSVPLGSCYPLHAAAAAAPTIVPPLSSPACPSFFGKICADGICVTLCIRRDLRVSTCNSHSRGAEGVPSTVQTDTVQTLSISGQQEQTFCHITVIFGLTTDSDFIGHFWKSQGS